MLQGKLVGLRAREESDVAVLHADLYDDVGTYSRAHSGAWVPLSFGPHSPYAVADPADSVIVFSVIELATGELAGDAVKGGPAQQMATR